MPQPTEVPLIDLRTVYDEVVSIRRLLEAIISAPRPRETGGAERED
ncbi:hypothetical protein [Falsiroseomonas sp. CW058]